MNRYFHACKLRQVGKTKKALTVLQQILFPGLNKKIAEKFSDILNWKDKISHLKNSASIFQK
jgi:hypothetical protein